MKKWGLLFCVVMLLFLNACNIALDRTFQVTETYNITSSKGTTSYLQINLPLGYGYQEVSEIRTSVEEYDITQEDGYQVFNTQLQGDGSQKTVEITYSVTLLGGNKTWDDTTVKDEYLLSDEYIDSDSQDIIDATVPLIIQGDDYHTAENIFNFVSKSIRFDRKPKINVGKQSASDTLSAKKGVCGDYATLMTAMLRAAGIPARDMSGLVYNDLRESGDWSHSAANGSHAWVEFFANNEWHFADPTWGSGYFDNTDGYHLSYGTENVDIDSKAYLDMISGIKDKGYSIIGAMTAPIKFVAWSEDPNAIVVPRVDAVEF